MSRKSRELSRWTKKSTGSDFMCLQLQSYCVSINTERHSGAAMKLLLKIGFSEKDAVKTMAQQNGTRIQWDGDRKSWYWEGESLSALPECLRPYAQTSPNERASADVFYLCGRGQTTAFPYEVIQAFSTKEALGTEIERLVKELERVSPICIREDSDSYYRAIEIGGMHAVQSGKRIGVGKHIPATHIRAHNELTKCVTENLGARLQTILDHIKKQDV